MQKCKYIKIKIYNYTKILMYKYMTNTGRMVEVIEREKRR